MDENTRIIIGIRLEKARQDLEAVRQLTDSAMYRIAISRAYYAIFGITTAVLLTKDIDRSKHSGVQAAFGRLRQDHKDQSNAYNHMDYQSYSVYNHCFYP